MKKLFRYLMVILFVLVCSGIGGYFYFRKSFAAPPNQLSLIPNGEWVEFLWSGGQVKSGSEFQNSKYKKGRNIRPFYYLPTQKPVIHII